MVCLIIILYIITLWNIFNLIIYEKLKERNPKFNNTSYNYTENHLVTSKCRSMNITLFILFTQIRISVINQGLI